MFIRLILALLCAGWSATGLAANFTKRDMTTSDLLKKYREAVLVNDGTKTSCEVAVLDHQNGLVTASCFDYLSNGGVDRSRPWKVAIRDPVSNTSGVFILGKITIHPQYDSSTLANNIAHISFNDDTSSSWKIPVAADRSEWDNTFYTTRVLYSAKYSTWNSPSAASIRSNADTERDCATASNLYKENSNSMMCITKAPASRINQLCTVPYGAAWGVYQPSDTAIAALYSHSVTKASSLCQATSVIYYYYTLLEPYVGWANKVGGKDFSVYWEDSSYDYSGSPSFSMKNVGGTSLSGSQILTGDFFKMQRNYVATSGANEDTALATKTDSPESSGNGDSKTSTIKANSNVDADANTDGDGNVSTSAFDEGDYIVMSGSTIAVTDLMTGTDQQNLELTRVYFLTETDDNGNVIVQTDVEVETYAYSNYMGHRDNSVDDHNSTEDSSNASGKNDTDKQTSSSSSKLSRHTIITIAVSVSLGTIIILICLFHLRKWWRQRRNAKSWDPQSENDTICIRTFDDLSNNCSMSDVSASLELETRNQCIESKNQRVTLPPYSEVYYHANINTHLR